MPKPQSNVSLPDFVSHIVKDPNKHVETLLLSGFLGPSSEKEHTRLYFDAGLSQHVEIPNKAILYSQQMPSESSPLGGAYVWIEHDAQRVHGRAGAQRAKAKFFEGPIAQAAGGPFTQPPPICNDTALHTPCVPCLTPPRTPCVPCNVTIPHTACGPCTPGAEVVHNLLLLVSAPIQHDMCHALYLGEGCSTCEVRFGNTRRAPKNCATSFAWVRRFDLSASKRNDCRGFAIQREDHGSPLRRDFGSVFRSAGIIT